jgi:probable rRNA maturation factor
MINFSIICRSKHWPARLKKVNFIVEKIMTFKKELGFKININYNCNIILSDKNLIKKMNYKYRNNNTATDVLTFVSEINLKKKRKTKICDMILAAEIIKKDATKNKITFYNHLTHLIIHSFLHLNDFTHKKFDNFNKMKEVEIKILKKLRINNPYLCN